MEKCKFLGRMLCLAYNVIRVEFQGLGCQE